MYIPAHVDLLRRLSLKFDVTAYTLIKPDNDSQTFRSGNATVKYANARFDDPGWKKIQTLNSAVGIDHKKEPFDLIHGIRALPSGLSAVMLGRKFRVPSVVSLQGGETANIPEIDYGDMRKQPLKSLILWVCRNAELLTTLTNFQLESLKQHGFRGDAAKVIPYGAEEIFFCVFSPKLPSPPYRLIHVGHMNKVKAQTTILNGFRLISAQVDCRLRIIGEDFLQGELQRLCRQLQLTDRVEFLAYVPHQQMAEHYGWADMMLHTSFYEGQAVVVAEAAAAGVPTCGSRVGLVADLSPQASSAVPVGDFEALSKVAIEILNNQIRYDQVRNNAHAWALTHDAQWTADQFEKVYNELT
jgi:glycosyltransferase involved in cell wall biosynthesis